MSYKEFQSGLRQYELSMERKEILSNLEAVLSKATRQKIQHLLHLPDRIRTRYIEENPNYRSAIRQLLSQRLETQDSSDDEEKREIMQGIIDGIEEVDRITFEIENLKRRKSDPPGKNEDPDEGKGNDVRKVG